MDIVRHADKFMTADVAAEYAGVSRSTLYRWIAEGILPRYRTRGTTRPYFTATDIDRITTPERETA